MIPSGRHPTLRGAALDDELAIGQFVIVAEGHDEIVCRDRDELTMVLARDFFGKSYIGIRWKKDEGPTQVADAPIQRGWGGGPT